ncbi:MAG: hypothetical protein Q9169_003141 [Polycauliona sp. 2 TL-2023]
MRDAIAESQLRRSWFERKPKNLIRMLPTILLSCVWISASFASSLQDRQASALDAGATVRPNPFGRPDTDATYDYVIVGGGTAGLTIAARLTQNTSLSVAVVEAGSFYEDTVGNLSTVPAYAAYNVGTDPNDTNAIDWGFVIEPQPGADNRRMHYARGKTLGGSSARNLMIYHRPTVGTMQKWADEVDDESYTWHNFLPFLKKSVNYSPPDIPYLNSTNSHDDGAFTQPPLGPLRVSFGRYEDPFGTWVQRAFQAIGQAAINGFQSGKLIGSSYMAFTVNPTSGLRSSSFSSFLLSAFRPGNGPSIRLYNNTLARRILFQPGTNIANGVVVSSSAPGNANRTYTLRARKEIIVSAGAFQSPQLLMVSGIGPRATLERHNISPIVKDLPGVGQNLQDQVFFGTSYRVDLLTASAALNNPALAAAAIAAFQNRTTGAAGPLTNPNVPVFGWENLPNSTLSTLPPSTQAALRSFPPDWPQLEFIPTNSVFSAENFAAGDPVDGYNYAAISTAIITPFSKGNISISSASTTSPPLINPAWLTHPYDRDIAIAAFKRQREVWAYLKLQNVTIGEEYKPGPGVSTDEQIWEYIRKNVGTAWHAAATCKMGRRGDGMAVVDSEGRVLGARRLRVVDASAFPFLTPGHPQSVVYALAEKVVDGILRGR